MQREIWAKIPTVAPYTWECWRNGVLILAEHVAGIEDTPLKALPNPPYTFIAVPHRENMPRIEVELEAGMEPIWGHVVKQHYALNFGGKVPDPTRFEYVFIGRRYANKIEEVWTVFPDGKVEQFDSVEKAKS